MDVPEQEVSPLEKVRRRLYARESATKSTVSQTGAVADNSSEGWKGEEGPKKKLPLSAIFLVVAGLFFVGAGIVAVLVLLLGGRTVSSDRLAISVDGPVSVSGGEVVPLTVIIENKNPSIASDVMLSLEFPEGTYDAESPTTPLTRKDVSLDDIPAGGTIEESVRAIFYGSEGMERSIAIRVSYKAENSNAVFEKEFEHVFTINSSPISLQVTALEEVTSGQPLSLVVSVRSNAPSALTNVGVAFSAPFGFALSDASPTPQNNFFMLGTLRPGEEREIRIQGTLSGQAGDEPVFSFSSGLASFEGARALSQPVYSTVHVPVRVTQSFLGVGLLLNGSQKETITIPVGEDVQASVSWANTLTEPIADGRITIALSGDALDPASVSAVNGFYRSSDRTVTFSRDTEPGLINLAPGDTGYGSFTFAFKDAKELDAMRNPTVTLTISVAGRRVGNVADNLVATETRTVRIASGMSISADAVRTVGPFENMGPWPPVVDTATTYTIRLNAGTSLNSVANAKVSLVLPQNVTFTGVTSAGDTITHNPSTRTVTWTLGDLVAGTSQDSAFQVSLTPTVSQQGRTPVLVESITASGFDRFTQTTIEGGADPLTTDIPNDPDFESGHERVQ